MGQAASEGLMIVNLSKGRSSDAAGRSALCSRLDRPPNLTLTIATHALSGLLVTVPEANSIHLIPFVYRPAAPGLKAESSQSQADKELSAVVSFPFVGIYEASAFASVFCDQGGRTVKGLNGGDLWYRFRYPDPPPSRLWTA